MLIYRSIGRTQDQLPRENLLRGLVIGGQTRWGRWSPSSPTATTSTIRWAILVNGVQGLMVNSAKFAIFIDAMARFAGQDRTQSAF